ncbi:MAG: NUDIX hydrolase [Scytonema sp. RU_4_4]|nr:NUDIX hydrolase [Scytonema sp. RU_4_4]NJR74109.1 NUDIX hydrolase [Scytonema sp. CRU_2_7]
MHKPGEIRVIALGLIRDSQYAKPTVSGACPQDIGIRIFVSEGYDPVKQQTFYRAMGGGVDFGETSLEALKREFQEEIQAELTNIRYLGCLENIFIYNGQPGHEIIQLFESDFVDPKFYEIEKLVFSEGERQKTALWVDMNRFQSKEFRLVPEQFLDYL